MGTDWLASLRSHGLDTAIARRCAVARPATVRPCLLRTRSNALQQALMKYDVEGSWGASARHGRPSPSHGQHPKRPRWRARYWLKLVEKRHCSMRDSWPSQTRPGLILLVGTTGRRGEIIESPPLADAEAICDAVTPPACGSSRRRPPTDSRFWCSIAPGNSS